MKGTGMKYLLLIVLLVTILVSAGCVTGNPTKPAGVEPPSKYSTQSQPARQIVISEETTSWETQISEPNYVIRGLVTNNLGRSEGYVLVTCTIYDTSGVKLGYSNDGLGELASGASARFEVEIPDSMIKGGFPKEFKWVCEAK